jgi:hypothetical protein
MVHARGVTKKPAEIEPDVKDWTWVLQQPCAECGFDAAALHGRDIGRMVRVQTQFWPQVLSRPDAPQRPAPNVWSPLEYACHVRDVCKIFTMRVELMRTEDDPEFANWDQDETALVGEYWSQDPRTVGEQLLEAARQAADAFDKVGDDEWTRTGRRSNGSVFTVETLGRYFVHDLVHHRHDVGA